MFGKNSETSVFDFNFSKCCLAVFLDMNALNLFDLVKYMKYSLYQLEI